MAHFAKPGRRVDGAARDLFPESAFAADVEIAIFELESELQKLLDLRGENSKAVVKRIVALCRRAKTQTIVKLLSRNLIKRGAPTQPLARASLLFLFDCWKQINPSGTHRDFLDFLPGWNRGSKNRLSIPNSAEVLRKRLVLARKEERARAGQ